MAGMVIDVSLIALHLTAGVIVVSSLARNLDRRQVVVDELAAVAAREHRDTRRYLEELRVQQHLLQDLRDRDPYVIELLARERHGYTGPNEVRPPIIDCIAEDEHSNLPP